MKRLSGSLLLICAFWISALSQAPNRPKLVVGLVIDQMRWDYLYRFAGRYGTDGFRRLMGEGMNCENTLIPFTPTHTAPGHACIYTGSVPSLHGIMGNSWYDREKKGLVYCAEDASVQSVGTTSSAGKMSPRHLWSSTITDELRLATNFRNKTIAIALKDRGAILPGGHTANGSYWFDNATGGWITSSHYMQDLPSWVKTFNARKLPDTYLQQDWQTLFPLSTYTQSTADSNAYEGRLGGKGFTFPHLTSAAGANRYEVFRTTPYGNTYTLDMGRAAIEGENLGGRGFTDFLALSLSSPDYIGHTFGPNSVEIEDTYLRLDRDIASFLRYLDSRIGKGQYLLFLTADHGAAHNTQFLKDRKLPAGIIEEGAYKRQLNDSLTRIFGVGGLIAQSFNYQIFLNDSLVRRNNIDRKLVKQYIIQFMLRHPGVAYAVDLENIEAASVPEALRRILQNGYNQKLSGDIQVVYRPQWTENWRTGTTHGLWNPYDSHIPLIWFGWNIRPGKVLRETYMTDIAPTLGALLHIQSPNASIGQVISEVVK